MKKRLQGLIAGVLIGVLSTGSVAFAKVGTEFIEAVYANVKIYIDGKQIEPRDVNGNKVEPFIYNGTTYLPVRAVGEAFGKAVSYDGKTKSVYVGMNPNEKTYLLDVCLPYEESYHCETYLQSEGESFLMAGKKYSNGLVFEYYEQDAYFNLNGEYETMTATIGHVDGSDMYDRTVSFVVDGNVVEEVDVYAEELPVTVEIPLDYGLQLKIVTSDGVGDTGVGIADIIVE